jgi:hypothetical protein
VALGAAARVRVVLGVDWADLLEVEFMQEGSPGIGRF